MKNIFSLELLRKSTQVLLGIALFFAGFSHLTSGRVEFRAQVPSFLSTQADFIVLASGVVEILLGLALVLLWRFRVQAGWVTALFFIAVFPGNIAQFVSGTDAFGLDSDQARFTRLFFQPVLIILALWSTGAWQNFRARRKDTSAR